MDVRFVVVAIAFVPIAAMSAVSSASLIRGDAADQVGSWVLTSQQLAYAETWIQGHKLDCLAGLGSPPTPAVRVHLVRSDGSDVSLGLYSKPRYSTAVETRVGKNLCHYRGSEAEVASLRRAIGRTG